MGSVYFVFISSSKSLFLHRFWFTRDIDEVVPAMAVGIRPFCPLPTSMSDPTLTRGCQICCLSSDLGSLCVNQGKQFVGSWCNDFDFLSIFHVA